MELILIKEMLDLGITLTYIQSQIMLYKFDIIL